MWAAAVASNAEYVVSEDRRRYPPADADGGHRYQGIEYMDSRNFRRMLLGDEPTVYDIAVQCSEESVDQ